MCQFNRKTLFAYDLGDKAIGHELTREGTAMFAREFYPDLYEVVRLLWESKSRRVVLLGNAGTGKSWFQMYVMRQLLQDDQDTAFKFAVREVAGPNKIFIHDLASCEVFQWIVDRGRAADIMEEVTGAEWRCLEVVSRFK